MYAGSGNDGAANDNNNNDQDQPCSKPSLASTLWKSGKKIKKGDNRHLAMLSIMDSLLIKFPNEQSEVLFDMAKVKNLELCVDEDGKEIAPIPELELRGMFEGQCKKFARKKLQERERERSKEEGGNGNSDGGGLELEDEHIQTITEAVQPYYKQGHIES